MAQSKTDRNGKVPVKSKGEGAARKKQTGSPKPAIRSGKQATRKLDRVSRKFDAGVEKLRDNLEVVGGCLYELLATEAGRERQRRFVALVEAGVLHDLQVLAAALEELPPEELPPSLSGVSRYARLAVAQLARTFDAQPIHKPGEELLVQENQQAKFDWSADLPGERTFPLCATVLRCGWKCGSAVLVKPRVTRASN